MTNAQSLFKQTPLYTDGIDYVILSLPATAITPAAGVLAEVGEAFAALVVDKDEVSLVISAEDYAEFTRRLPGAQVSAPLRLISLDAVLPPDLTGFMALIAGILAEANIPIIPLGAFSRDHLLVPADRADEALRILKEHQQ